MRFFLELAVLLLVLAVPAAVVLLVLRPGAGNVLTGRSRREAIARARWRAGSEVVSDRTIVSISKVIPTRSGEESLGRMVVAEIAATDPEWDVRVSQALMDARVRAEILNQEGEQGRLE
ncbi:MAG: hypothetical protein QOJ79_2696 [Actinomycetota bacterium]|nr:hypothetical protein [Actinomycetota bacterium]